MGDKEVELPFSRGEFCDEDVTELFLNADTSKPNEWAIFIEKVDLVKMGAGKTISPHTILHHFT